MAVYTAITDEQLTSFLAAYDIGPLLSFKGIAEGVENSNFLLHTGAGYFILTLYEKRVNAEDLPFFIGLMHHLFERGISCPEPVSNRQGKVLGELAGRPAAIVTFLDGLSLDSPSSQHCAALGEGLAKMHLAGQDFELTRPNALSVSAWRPLFEQAGAKVDTIEPGLADLIARELDYLEQNWPSDLPAGVIHADLFPDNVFFLQSSLSGFIDFYFSCNDMLAYDAAICINAWCFNRDQTFDTTKAEKFLTSYQMVRKFTDNEKTKFPILLRGSAIRFLLTRVYDWLNVPKDAIVVPKSPLEYINKVKFHQSITNFRIYGVR